MNWKYLGLSVGLWTMLACQSPSKPIARSTSSVENMAKYFRDVTHDSGIPTLSTAGLNAGDYDNDGFTDLLAQQRLFRNIGIGKEIRFEEVTQRVGLDSLKGNPVFVDLNNNGLLDIISTSGQVFLQKAPGVFIESSAKMGLRFPKNVNVVSFGDLNQDGYPDLVVGLMETLVSDEFTFEPPRIYKNIQGLRFQDVSAESQFEKYPSYVRGISWADFDNSNSPDLFFSVYRLRPSYLFKNTSGRLSEVAGSRGVQGVLDPKKYFDEYLKLHFGPQYGHTLGAVWADFNNDGNLDLWVSNLVHKFVGLSQKAYDYRGYLCGDSHIYQNMGAPDYKFVDRRGASEIPLKAMGDYTLYEGDELWSHATAADFDNDGLLDVYVPQVYNLDYAYSLLYKNKGGFRFSEIGEGQGLRVLDSYAGIWADFNNDGKMDLVTSGRGDLSSQGQVRIFENIGVSKNHYLRVRLVGASSGRSPVAAQVRVYHAKGLFLRQYEGVIGSNNQQNDPTLHFGLGSVERILYIDVQWPSGKRQRITNVKVDGTLSIVEPD